MKKVEKLICETQPLNWLHVIMNECREYPIHLIDIQKDDLVIDVGANVGGFFKVWESISDNWYLVEPSKYNQQQIENNLKGFNYKLFKNAVSDQSGKTLKLQKYIDGNTNQDSPSGNMGTSGFVYSHNKLGWQGDYEEVESISLEDLCKDSDVGLLKVDCEGAELDFLMGKDLSNIKYIVMELHNFLGKEKQQLLCDWIKNTHEEIYTKGEELYPSREIHDKTRVIPTFHYLKMWCLK
jgi:FkbM family methyltransferase